MRYTLNYLEPICAIILTLRSSYVSTSPVFIPGADILTPRLPENLCFNEALEEGGYARLIEDCGTLRRFETPPEQILRFLGSNIQVCCPETTLNLPKTSKKESGDEQSSRIGIESIGDDDGSVWDFPSDPPKSSIRKSSNGDYEYYDNLYEEAFDKEKKDYDFDFENYYEHKCPEEKICSDLEQCDDKDFSRDSPPLVCGYNAEGKDKLCCSPNLTGKVFTEKVIDRKFGKKNYPCSDYHPICPFYAKKTPESCNPSHKSYPFMRAVCMGSCKRCGDKGCRDEFEECGDWKNAGYCVKFPDFMQYNCRETCGTCGFLSPRNRESQVVRDNDYSNIDAAAFFCGEGKKKAEINTNNTVSRDKRETSRNKREEIDSDIWTAPTVKEENRRITCGSTIVNDRFIVFAAHCETDFKPSGEQDETVRSIIVRDGTIYEETIEIRRVFVHPGFKFPSLYDDIAIAELGRRIKFDYDKFGHSPSCLGTNTNIANGKEAQVQGYGRAEDGETSDVLREATVNIIENIDCSSYLNGNVTHNAIRKAKVKQTLPNGINTQLICSTGIKNGTTGVYTGPCEGDSGGPLFINYGSDGRKRQTLEGITSGGLSCGQNFPSWYTRVASYRPWILCIIKNVRKGYRKSRVEKICEKESGNFEKENIIE